MAISIGVLNIAVLVFREGLECILVLAAITANLLGPRNNYRCLVLSGAAAGFLATIATWWVASRVINDLSQDVSALKLQAGTGLLAVIVLLVVMNWFFHKTYWTGWIASHNRRKHALLAQLQPRSFRAVLGFALLGFSSFYGEGVEVVLFLQSYRLRVGPRTIQDGVLVGFLATVGVGILTFVAHKKLPYKRMLVLTGMLLGVVLFVMVGEQVQEMQLAHWLRTSPLPWVAERLPEWTGLWFSISPTVECLVGQALAISLVIGSYFIARERVTAAG